MLGACRAQDNRPLEAWSLPISLPPRGLQVAGSAARRFEFNTLASSGPSPLHSAGLTRSGEAVEMMRTLVAALVAVVGVSSAIAQDRYPTKPVRWVIPYAPGSGTDVIARPITIRLGEVLGQATHPQGIVALVVRDRSLSTRRARPS